MTISSLIVKCKLGNEENIASRLRKFCGITVEEVLQGQLILVMENESLNEAHEMMDKEINNIPGVLGIYPAYIYFEDEFSA
ncbi:MAG: hypothetical protein PWQ96_1851 [Clostridia bacterium]|jgi:nitrate reductase NapD|nr:hypothetical protein [Clostridia bacterium]